MELGREGGVLFCCDLCVELGVYVFLCAKPKRRTFAELNILFQKGVVARKPAATPENLYTRIEK
jgi:hypothetical protein